MAKTSQANNNELINDLIATVHDSSKYQAVSADLIRIIGVRELAARRNLKEAVKATKNKLHQVAGAYFDARRPYAKWLEQLAAAVDDGQLTTNNGQLTTDHLQQRCREMMADHASTRERLALRTKHAQRRPVALISRK